MGTVMNIPAAVTQFSVLVIGVSDYSRTQLLTMLICNRSTQSIVYVPDTDICQTSFTLRQGAVHHLDGIVCNSIVVTTSNVILPACACPATKPGSNLRQLNSEASGVM